jgi:hypothetical protein
LNLKGNKAGGKGTEKDGRCGRLSAAFNVDEKGDKAHKGQTLKDIPGSFNLQADEAVLAGTVMVQMGEFKGPGEKDGEEKADGKERSFPRNLAHRSTIPDLLKIVNRRPASFPVPQAGS